MTFGVHAGFATKIYTQANTLSISQAFVTDGSNNLKTSFKSGDSINYHVIGNNSSGNTLNVSINFWADTQNNGQQHIIIDKTFSLNIAAGGFNDFTMSAIPAGTVSGTYTFNGLVYENSNRSNNASLQSSSFSVAYIASYPLQIPYFSQFQGQQSQAEDCGPTSVAMVVSYYTDVNPYNQQPKDLIVKIRSIPHSAVLNDIFLNNKDSQVLLLVLLILILLQNRGKSRIGRFRSKVLASCLLSTMQKM